jgi:hypothetical protein
VSTPRFVLLGPQRLKPTLRKALAALPQAAPIALVSAGWEEREQEDGELREHVRRPVVNLRLYERAEEVFRRDRELFRMLRKRHDRLRKCQDYHRVILGHAMDAARELMRRRTRERGIGRELIELEIEEAIQVIRTIDARHAERLGQLHGEFEAEAQPASREQVVRQRAELERDLADVAAVCVAGGHVAILLNRLRLFDFPALVGERPLVCWSAGAMALAPLVVVFHDSPPQGRGNAEVLEKGLGMLDGVVPLPHAKRRLRLKDPARVGLFARRFAPALCAALDEGTRIDWNGERWCGAHNARRLTEQGSVVRIPGEG